MTPLTRLPIVAASIDAVVAHSERCLMDEAAFQAFYSRTAGPIFGYLRRLTGNDAVAEDLLQDAYVRFLAVTRLPDTDDHRRNYLYRIATNLARDYFRHQKLEHGKPTESRVDSTERRLGATEPRLGAMEPRVGAVEPRVFRPGVIDPTSDVWRLLAHVSPRDRELLVLAYVEEMTHAEIAAVTGLMRASIKPLLFRARRRYLAVLAEAGLTPERRTP